MSVGQYMCLFFSEFHIFFKQTLGLDFCLLAEESVVCRMDWPTVQFG